MTRRPDDLQPLVLAMRAVCADLDGGRRVAAARSVRELLSGDLTHSRYVKALLSREVGHGEGCPLLLAACANREEAWFDRLAEGLLRYPGAELLHVVSSRPSWDRPLVKRLRRWAAVVPAPVPRLLLFDGNWSEQGPASGKAVLGKLSAWLSWRVAKAQTLYSLRTIWHRLLFEPATVGRWDQAIREVWPSDTYDDCEYLLGTAQAVRKGQTPAEPRNENQRFVYALARLVLLQRPFASPTRSLAVLDAVCSSFDPQLFERPIAHACGVLIARGVLSQSDSVAAIERSLHAPSEASLRMGAPFPEERITGFLGGLLEGVAEGPGPSEETRQAMLGRTVEILRLLRAAENLDGMGRVRGAILEASVALGAYERLVEPFNSPERSHPYELDTGTRSLARIVSRSLPELAPVVEPVLARLRTGCSSHAYSLLSELCDALPDEAPWQESKRRLSSVRHALRPGTLLGPMAVAEIFAPASISEEAIGAIVRSEPERSGLFTAHQTESERRFRKYAAALERAETLAERCVELARWLAETEQYADTVQPAEAVKLWASLRRLHVAWFIGSSRHPGRATLGHDVHGLIMSALRGAMGPLGNVLERYPAGTLVDECVLALTAEAFLLPPAEEALVRETRAECRKLFSRIWERYLPARAAASARDPRFLVRTYRAQVASHICGLSVPAPPQHIGTVERGAELLRRLEGLEQSFTAGLSGSVALLKGEVAYLNGLREPRDRTRLDVVKLLLHNLSRRFDLGSDEDLPARAVFLVRRLRSFLAGPFEPVTNLASMVEDAVALARHDQAKHPRIEIVAQEEADPLPYTVCLLLMEELVANAIEHGDASLPVKVFAPGSSALFTVTSAPESGSVGEAIGKIMSALDDDVKGLRFAWRVAASWGLAIKPQPNGDRVSMSLVRRGDSF